MLDKESKARRPCRRSSLSLSLSTAPGTGLPQQPLVQLSQPLRDLLVRNTTQFPGTIQHVKAAEILSSGLLQSHRIQGGIHVVLEPQG